MVFLGKRSVSGYVAVPATRCSVCSGSAFAGFGLGDLIDQAVNAEAVWAGSEKGGLMQQALQIQLGVLADQFHLETIGLTDGNTLGVR